jgi:hypothetical protein
MLSNGIRNMRCATQIGCHTCGAPDLRRRSGAIRPHTNVWHMNAKIFSAHPRNVGEMIPRQLYGATVAGSMVSIAGGVAFLNRRSNDDEEKLFAQFRIASTGKLRYTH